MNNYTDTQLKQALAKYNWSKEKALGKVEIV